MSIETDGSTYPKGKPIVRVGVHIDPETVKLLEAGRAGGGISPHWFMVDPSGTIASPDGLIWLYYVGDDEAAISRMWEVVTRQGGLPMKSAGMLTEPQGERPVGDDR